MNIANRFYSKKLSKCNHVISSTGHWYTKSSPKDLFAVVIVFTLLALSACSLLPIAPRSNPGHTSQQPTPTFNKNVIVTIKGTAFHDYNGNGIKEYNEPVLSGLDVMFFDPESEKRFKIQTDSYGKYSCSIPEGKYQLIISENFPGYNGQPFRYLYGSKNEVNQIDELIHIIISKDMIYDMALMQGLLTLPFSIVTSSYITTVFFDVDKRENFIRDWQGNQETYDQHLGIDYRIPIGTPVIAGAPGIVISSKYDKDSGNVIAISHGLIITRYGHLDKRSVNAGDRVTRGQQIGLSGFTGEWVGKFPHLHFDLNIMILPRIDIYRDVTDPASVSYWTVDNKPQYP